ncbi:HNH endonuclease [Pseudomonas aegrilactucae]|uniref:HNH endonuclease n=1 Tax=Pseudomonas aegrilactucae TaxID=2854028 RepID=A0A9Q2XLX5_9PSED|nr:HNH endonuclease signature motif containing protein [Pseudomonas aegrilactucae]MBV6289313.1 HNH endonuclease [Pseudomonas aegrilactucae]
MQFFWVNLGATHKEAKKEGFLWAPLKSRSVNGKLQRREHWDNVGEVKSGDLIFCYHDNYVRGVAQAQQDAYVSERPPSRSFKEWEQEGFRVDVFYEELKRPIRNEEIGPAYQARFDSRTRPTLFNRTGGVNQIYMAKLPADAALFLLEQADIIANYEDKIVDSGSPERISSTTREAIIKARVGQGVFRSKLIKRWEGRCALTGVQNPNLLVASHIEAWSLADNDARLDPENGLLLATHIDRLFDCGLISFQHDGKLIISEKLTAGERETFGLNRYDGIKTLSEQNLTYLKKHRSRFSLS